MTKKPKSKGTPETMTGRTPSKNPAQNSTPKNGLPPEPPRTPMEWTDAAHPGLEWLSTTTPPGECAPARIRISSRNRDSSYSYFCYRDATAVGVLHSLENAKKRCEAGKSPRLSDDVIAYVEKHPGEIPPFLLLTEGERGAVRSQYPYAVPAPRALRIATEAVDPGTKKLLAELKARENASSGGQRSTRAAKKDALADPSARLTLPMAGTANPAKPGTKRHAGYEVLLGCARRGATVAEYLAAGGKDLRLAKAVRTGLVELKKGEK